MGFDLGGGFLCFFKLFSFSFCFVLPRNVSYISCTDETNIPLKCPCLQQTEKIMYLTSYSSQFISSYFLYLRSSD